MGQTIWRFAEGQTHLRQGLAEGLGIAPLTAQLLINRGVLTIDAGREFLSTPLTSLHDPFIMLGMSRAVARITEAIIGGEPLLIYGDYDVDGTTATALLVRFFRELGVPIAHYLPERAKEGYGLNAGALQTIRQQGTSVVISVDCGINAWQAALEAKRLGIDLIITDHHVPPPELPPAYAILNPRQEGCPYPFKALSGVGIAFKLALALRATLRSDPHFDRPLPNLKRHLDLVALGTVADIAPLQGENRTLVRHGLQELAATLKPGLQALKAVSGLHNGGGTGLGVSDVGFRLAPRLNAAGRLGDAQVGLELLITDDAQRAQQLANHLDRLNRERQIVQERILLEVKERLARDEALPADRGIVLDSKEWHRGVIGIVAAKVAETFHRPTALIQVEGEYGVGSARSIPGYDLYEGLSQCSDLFKAFGGHRYAAGFTIERGKIEAFKERFKEVVARELKEEPRPLLTIDAIVSLGELSLQLMKEIELLAPFGCANPPPLLCCQGVALAAPPQVVGQRGEHLRLRIQQNGTVRGAIGFNMGKIAGLLPHVPAHPIDIAFTPQAHTWHQVQTVDLHLREIQLPS